MKHNLLLFLVTLFLPFVALAEDSFVSRGEALELLWQPLRRAVAAPTGEAFSDVQGDHRLHVLATYARTRGIVEDGAYFFPDEPLHLRDALLWLLRSRNVAEWPALTPEAAPAHARRYGLIEALAGTRDRRTLRALLTENSPLSREELMNITNALDSALTEERHTVSYYGNSFAGRRTAFGEIFDPGAMTAAHRTFPHNTIVRLVNTENENSVTVRINDRGPYIAGRDMDVSRAAFEHLGPISRGVLHGITFERLGSNEIMEHRQENEGRWHEKHAARRQKRLAARR
jgi:rare lipoprotein A (peptidoglycan hydrolase)